MFVEVKVLNSDKIRQLVQVHGRLYSEMLGINISSGEDGEIFKWLLASLLFGAPIRDSTAMKTYESFKRHDVLTPERILAEGWKGLITILDEGGYARYDEKTADKLLLVAKNLQDRYGGNLVLLCKHSLNASELEQNLKGLGKGIGDTTASIFLRELRDVWTSSESKPTPLVIESAEKLGIVRKGSAPEKALEQMKLYWEKNKIRGKSFANFETALSRMGIETRRKKQSDRRSRVKA